MMFDRRAPGTKRNQRGITGLETAIVLIAFVMVASVFSYVVLSAGLFSSQKAKEAVHTGLQQTRSSVVLKGNVLARMVNGTATEIMFTLSLVPGAEAVDLTDTSGGENVVIISYADGYQQYPSLDWTVTKLSSSGSDYLLDENELFQVIVDLSAVNDGASSDAERPGSYHTFMLEIKPPSGAVLTIERTIPARVNQLVTLC